MDRVLILGASRGFGAALVQHLSSVSCPVLGIGRKKAHLRNLRERFPSFRYEVADFSQLSGQEAVLRLLQAERFGRIIYVAGGGPYGRFEDRAWKDHQWCWEVTFHFPARLLHALLAAKRRDPVILIGSSVAENAADSGAASYSSAKHALRGLFCTLREENPKWDIRLFSPGYMDTELLPKNAAVRQLGVYRAEDMAEELWTWSLTADAGGHRVYSIHPSSEL